MEVICRGETSSARNSKIFCREQQWIFPLVETQSDLHRYRESPRR
jgi:hypothetical protein